MSRSIGQRRGAFETERLTKRWLTLFMLSALLTMVGGTGQAQYAAQYQIAPHGISLAIDCGGTMYATSNATMSMYIWQDISNGEATTVPTRDSTGNLVPVDEISWDAGRGLLWGASGFPSLGEGVTIHTITRGGLCTAQFHVRDPKWPFGGVTGLAYDPDPEWPGGSLWIAWNQVNFALHYTLTGELIGRVELPMDNTNPYNITGVCATPAGLWCARVGISYRIITFHSKSGGLPDPALTIRLSTAGLVEGIECECNPAGFPPGTCLLWARDSGPPETFTAYSIAAGSCDCPKKRKRK